MYDAARACLAGAGVEPESGEFKTHHGLISTFGLHIVKPGLFAVEIGKAIQSVQTPRQIADYEATPFRGKRWSRRLSRLKHLLPRLPRWSAG